MKIYIKEKGKRGFGIPLPYWMIRMGLSETVIRIVSKNVSDEQRKYIDAIDFRSLSHSLSDLKKYKGLNLVNVKSKNGDEVKITV